MVGCTTGIGREINRLGRLVRPASVRVVEVARSILGLALTGVGLHRPQEHRDPDHTAGDPDDAPDRVGGDCERQDRARYLRSTTIVFTEAVTPSATSTTTT